MACVIEIRDRELYVLVGSGNHKKLKVQNAFRIFLQDSLFINHDVNLNESMINYVKNALEEKGIKDKKVHLVINHRTILSKNLTVPKTDKKKLGFLVTNEMTTSFNLTRDFIVDYRVLNELEVEGHKQYHVAASAMRRSSIEGLEIFFEGMGMKIQSIESASNAFLNFVEKFDVVDTFDPVVVIDASSSYIRYFMFNHKNFMMMRSVLIHIDDDASVISKRVAHVLDLLNQSQQGVTGKPITKVIVVGYEKRFKFIEQISEQTLNIPSLVPDIFGSITPNDIGLYDFTNSMGVLV